MSNLNANPLANGPVNAADFIERLRSSRELGKNNGVEGLKSKGVGEAEFDKILEERNVKSGEDASGLRFSSHASSRLQSRGIELSSDDLVKMQEAVDRARAKGSKESLLLTDKAAFVVSVKNNTVITAVDRGSMKENVFTNIDSTIMI